MFSQFQLNSMAENSPDEYKLLQSRRNISQSGPDKLIFSYLILATVPTENCSESVRFTKTKREN